MKLIMIALMSLVLLSGCSTKEMKETVGGWKNDIQNAFENSKDPALDSNGSK